MRKLTRVATTGGLLTALLAASIAIAPAAEAATHKVTDGYASQSESLTVGTHKDKLSLKKASSKVVYIGDKDYAPAAYTFTLKNSTGKVLYTHKVSTWQGLNAFLDAPAHTYGSDSALVKRVKHDSGLSVKAAKKAEQALEKRLSAEFGLAFTLGFGFSEVYGWVQQHPQATTFDDFYAALSAKDAAGFKTILSGTPQDYTLHASDKGTGIGLTLHIVDNDQKTAKAQWTGPVLYGTFKQGNATTTLKRN